MIKSIQLTPIAALVLGLSLMGFSGVARGESLESLVTRASSSQPEEAQGAIDQLRALGPVGLRAFIAAKHQELEKPGLPDASLRELLDRLCQQRDCYASQLYWYTNLEAAKAAARASGKPILSLRLLGNLDEDLSCANSRFFRVALYANSEVSQKLRDRVILHWESVRPVPTVTVDFGDGRILKRTITGNSIHYLLDAQGRPLDALPGLHGPQAFLDWLDRAVPMAQQFAQLPDPEKGTFLAEYHRSRIEAIQQQWQTELTALNLAPPQGLEPIPPSESDAETAGRVAMTKMVVEFPLLRQIGVVDRNRQTLESVTDIDTWRQLAQKHSDLSRLDSNSLALMQKKNPALADPEELQKVQTQFEQMMALDTVRNEYLLHQEIHQWFLAETGSMADVAVLNDRVYAQLFLTPNSDPWLGIAPDDVYNAIDNGGVGK